MIASTLIVILQQYIPYFASAMLDANETDPGYFDVRGTMLIDPAISSDVALVERMTSSLIPYFELRRTA